MSTQKKRCFAALRVNTESELRIVGLQRRLATAFPSVRLSPPENLHLTICFFGDLTPAQLSALTTGLYALTPSLSPPRADIVGVDAFPSGLQPVSIYAAVKPLDQALAELFSGVETLYRTLGLKSQPGARVPHVTLGRLSKTEALRTPAFAPWAEELRSLLLGTLESSRLYLFESLVGAPASRYVQLCEAPFAV